MSPLVSPLVRPGLTALLAILAIATPALAISDRRDQPTQADVPDTARGGSSEVAPPQAIRPDTKVMPGDTGLSGNARARTNPLEQLDAKDRRATGGGDGAGDRR
ncbi:hypothetical protein [Methylobacterium platani]|uniref:Uncharacterized protein n=2 Tax=Methylobacterium platani TaxID=427683 RepID=A0A179SJ12_9HYPH|nr:hypothetical protein [Methylobacterium platani]KMO16506.1 hypothetical protein SQ03_14460 [Methylobacterium platani JCM 14648]OAS27442.1 hypothetical protein A5481_01370 [Methylobacterium platani]